MRVLILTEGGKGIGFGHITRMLAVYQAFEEAGVRPYMLVKGDNSVGSVLKEARWEILDWVNDPASVKERFGKVDILMIDSYLAPREVYEYLSKMAKVPAYYDDFGRIEYPCGVVINGWFRAIEINYPTKLCVKYLLGVEFLPLRKEFWKIKKKETKDNIESILITFGGSDPKGVTPRALKVLVSHFPNLIKRVIIGRGFGRNIIEYCKKIADEKTKIIYFPDGGHIKNLMLKSDIAISAGGQTLHELARVGVPTVAVIVANNQEAQVKEFFSKGLIHRFFYWNELKEESIVDSIKSLQNPLIRKRISEKAKNFIKGQGARKIVKCLYELWKTGEMKECMEKGITNVDL